MTELLPCGCRYLRTLSPPAPSTAQQEKDGFLSVASLVLHFIRPVCTFKRVNSIHCTCFTWASWLQMSLPGCLGFLPAKPICFFLPAPSSQRGSRRLNPTFFHPWRLLSKVLFFFANRGNYQCCNWQAFDEVDGIWGMGGWWSRKGIHVPVFSVLKFLALDLMSALSLHFIFFFYILKQINVPSLIRNC